ncbi:MAG TPA: hypothetical protein VGT08_21090 [Terracidiphilus sp.]|nr:hypothetical protein [Terracidiphilus sp.]
MKDSCRSDSYARITGYPAVTVFVNILHAFGVDDAASIANSSSGGIPEHRVAA